MKKYFRQFFMQTKLPSFLRVAEEEKKRAEKKEFNYAHKVS
jgi:hypothetical protein